MDGASRPKQPAAAFGTAFRGDLVEAFADAGNDVEHLNKYEALKGELKLRYWLQGRAVAAYSNLRSRISLHWYGTDF